MTIFALNCCPTSSLRLFCVLNVLFFFSFFTLLHKYIDVIELEEKLLLTGKLFPSKMNLNKSNTRSPANTLTLQSHIEIKIQVGFKYKQMT